MWGLEFKIHCFYKWDSIFTSCLLQYALSEIHRTSNPVPGQQPAIDRIIRVRKKTHYYCTVRLLCEKFAAFCTNKKGFCLKTNLLIFIPIKSKATDENCILVVHISSSTQILFTNINKHTHTHKTNTNTNTNAAHTYLHSTLSARNCYVKYKVIIFCKTRNVNPFETLREFKVY